MEDRPTLPTVVGKSKVIALRGKGFPHGASLRPSGDRRGVEQHNVIVKLVLLGPGLFTAAGHV